MMLDSHPALAIPWESHFIPQFIGSPAELVQRLQSDTDFQRWAVDLAGLEDEESYAAAVREVYARYAAGQGKAMYGDKTPSYALHIPLLARLFPESRFIHIVRDGRNVAPSIVEAGFAADLEAAALTWRRHTSVARIAGRRLSRRRYLEVSYECLVEDAERTLREVCHFLDLAYDSAMLDYPDRIESVAPGLPAIDRHLRHSPSRTRDWQDQLTVDEVSTFESIAGDVLVAFGYEPSTPRSWRQSFERLRAHGSYLRARRRAAVSLP
jgi:hypothetical protein